MVKKLTHAQGLALLASTQMAMARQRRSPLAALPEVSGPQRRTTKVCKLWYVCNVDDREARAAERRRTWQGGVAKSFAEAEEQDLAFWMSATPQERVRGLTELVAQMFAMEEDVGSPARLQRAVGGVRSQPG